MILSISPIPKHSYILIAVPSERMDNPVSDYTKIESEGQKYKIIERVTIFKNEPMPSTLTLLSIGKEVMYFEMWNAFKKSDRIIFFICEKINSNTTS